MDRIRSWIPTLAPAFALGAAALVANAQPLRPDGPPPSPAGLVERALEALELDPETSAAAYAVLDAARPTARALRATARAAHDELLATLARTGPDEAEVLTRLEAVHAIHGEALKHDLRTLLEVRRVLGPEQEARLIDVIAAARPGGPVGG